MQRNVPLIALLAISPLFATFVSLSSPVISSLKDIQSLSNKGTNNRAVDVTAQATMFNQSHAMLILQRDGVGTYCYAKVPITRPIQLGDWLRVQGHATPGGFSPVITVSKIDWLHSGKLPQPLDVTSGLLTDPMMENLWAKIRVHILQLRESRNPERDPITSLRVATPDGLRFTALLLGSRVEEVSDLAGADVEITGVVGTRSDGYGRKIAPSLLLKNRSQIALIQRNPVDWSVPLMKIGSILTHGSTHRLGDRVRVEGVVVYSEEEDFFYLSDNTGGTIIWPMTPARPKVGESLQATGTLTREGDHFGLAEAYIRPSPPIELKPINVTSDSDPGMWVGGQLIRTIIRFHYLERMGLKTVLFGDLKNVPVTAEWVRSNDVENVPDFHAGDIVSIRGVADFTNNSADLKDLRILVRQPSDVQFVRRVAWWNRVSWGRVALIGLILLLGGTAWILSLRRQVKVQTKIADKARETAMANERDRILAQERSRLARDIHDTLAQGYAAILTQSHALRRSMGSPPSEQSSEHIHLIERVATDNLAQARKTMDELRNDPFERADLGTELGKSIRDVVDASFRVDLRLPPEAVFVPRYMQMEVCRIVQEALVNAQRHARTGDAVVSVISNSHNLMVAIIDKGVGFNFETVGDSFGIRGMQERAVRAGATVEIASSPGYGTQVRIAIEKGSKISGSGKYGKNQNSIG